MIFSINLENSIFLTTTTTTQQNPIIFYKKSKTGVNYIWILYLTEKSMSTGIFKLQMNFNECILLQSDKWQYRLPNAYPPPPPHIFNFYVSSYFCSENESVLHIHVFFFSHSMSSYKSDVFEQTFTTDPALSRISKINAKT